jgi:hypothetical protein
MMTKAELLADLAAKSKEILNTEVVETVGNVNRYISNVFTMGFDSNGAPIAQKRNVNWYVYDEGGAGEAAGYGDREFVNPEDKNPTGSDLLDVYGIWRNADLRNRVAAVLCNQVRAVLAEDPGSDDRRRVAKACLQDMNTMVTAFMEYVASNATIQSNGGAATDSDVE